MRYTTTYQSPIGEILPAADDIGLTDYAGGIDKKTPFFKVEEAFKEEYFVPKRSTAP